METSYFYFIQYNMGNYFLWVRFSPTLVLFYDRICSHINCELIKECDEATTYYRLGTWDLEEGIGLNV